MAAALLLLVAIAGIVICFVFSVPHQYRLLTSLPIALTVFVTACLMAKICPIYYFLSHAWELPPWQLYQHSATESLESCDTIRTDDDVSSKDKSDVQIRDVEKGYWSLDFARAERMDPLGPRNKWNNEPWILMYRDQPLWSKLFGRSLTIKEKGLIVILKKVLLQSLVWSLCLTMIWTIIVISIP